MAFRTEEFAFVDEELLGTSDADLFVFPENGPGNNTALGLAGDDIFLGLGKSPTGIVGGSGADSYVFNVPSFPLSLAPFERPVLLNDFSAEDELRISYPNGAEPRLLTDAGSDALGRNPQPYETVLITEGLEGATNGSIWMEVTGDQTWDFAPSFGVLDTDVIDTDVPENATASDFNAVLQGPTEEGNFVQVITLADGSDGSERAAFDFFAMSPQSQVAALYLGYFGRAADAGGRTFWVGEVEDAQGSGQSAAIVAEEMASDFRFSDEAQGLFPFLDPANAQGAGETEISTFVQSVFDNLFNRTPGADGTDFWVGEVQDRLSNNEKIGDVIVDIMAGAQGADADILENKINVANLYTDQVENFQADASMQIVGQVGVTEASVQDALAQF